MAKRNDLSAAAGSLRRTALFAVCGKSAVKSERASAERSLFLELKPAFRPRPRPAFTFSSNIIGRIQSFVEPPRFGTPARDFFYRQDAKVAKKRDRMSCFGAQKLPSSQSRCKQKLRLPVRTLFSTPLVLENLPSRFSLIIPLTIAFCQGILRGKFFESKFLISRSLVETR